MDQERRISKKALDPDLVILNGHVITVDDQFSIAEAVAVKDSKIIAVGDSNEVKALIGQDTQVLNLQKKTMLPGIVDHHTHSLDWALTIPPLRLDMAPPAVQSIKDIVALIKEYARTSEPGEGIFGQIYEPENPTETKKGQKSQLTRYDLDHASPDNPICLQHISRKYLWANSRSLELAQIKKDTPDPEGFRVERDPTTGEPTGLIEVMDLANLSDIFMIGKLLPSLTMRQRQEGFLAVFERLNSIGITSIVEAGHGVGLEGLIRGTHDSVNLTVLNEIKKEGRLNVRVTILLLSQDILTPGSQNLGNLKKYLNYVATNTGFGDEWVRIGGIKFLADFIHINKSAWMYDEYVGGGKGALHISGKDDEERYNELINMISYAHRCKWQMGIHVVGDRATDAVVDGFVNALQEDPWDARHYIIHGPFLTHDCARRMGEHNIGASIQVINKWWCIFSDLEEQAVGPKRNAYSFPMRTLLDAGVRVANGSDIPDAVPDWKRGIEAAVTRISKITGKINCPEQRVSRKEAIRSYTIDAAYLDHQDKIKGSIEVGKLADFCILDQDILTVDAEKIHEIPVLMTIVGGRAVFDAGSKDIKATKGSIKE